MATLAFLVLTLTAVQEQPDLSPRITWFFTEQACLGCALGQLTMMRDWIRPQDQIILQGAERSWFSKNEPGKIEGLIKERFPDFADHLIIDADNDCQIKTGWRWRDPITGESIAFSAAPGSYNSLRSKELLKLVRQ